MSGTFHGPELGGERTGRQAGPQGTGKRREQAGVSRWVWMVSSGWDGVCWGPGVVCTQSRYRVKCTERREVKTS